MLLIYEGNTRDKADSSISCTKAQFTGLMAGSADAAKEARVSVDETVPGRMVKYMTQFERNFNIIEP